MQLSRGLRSNRSGAGHGAAGSGAASRISPRALRGGPARRRYTDLEQYPGMEEIQMGKGDLRTRRGKIYNGSHGKKRPGRPARKAAPPAPAAPARGGRR
jgi:30S ribosomal protein S31